ncbi:MAG: 4-hydroxythreonine-4-phosphate dehydrogenase PdxA [Oligoflexia bacterium]|nr:4-hydroxythreonine-4-phosphate dehydrogenase PdxA [Oligoflexia bacterium]
MVTFESSLLETINSLNFNYELVNKNETDSVVSDDVANANIYVDTESGNKAERLESADLCLVTGKNTKRMRCILLPETGMKESSGGGSENGGCGCVPQSTQALMYCLHKFEQESLTEESEVDEGDEGGMVENRSASVGDNLCENILLTLPTSKDQLVLDGKLQMGHTEFLRSYFRKPELPMVFIADDVAVLLITDHIPLRDVAKTITSDLIVEKVAVTLNGQVNRFSQLDEVFIAGINPHAGENGLLGNEDVVVSDAITRLKERFPDVDFLGPISADTLFFHKKRKKRQLFVYMFHDQGLPLFKSIYGFTGLNVTFGLPFLRMSVDHGTAFELFGQNMADSSGALYMLRSALRIDKAVLKFCDE